MEDAVTPRRICFVTYEIHPTTWGGCGVLLHHAADLLLRAGHEVVFLLDVPPKYVAQFRDVDRLSLPNAERCSVTSVGELVQETPWTEEEIASPFQWKALRFSLALRALVERETIDFVEWFEYCGVGAYALAEKRYGASFGETDAFKDVVLGMRVHNSIELIDSHEATKPLTLDRYLLYALERSGLHLAETVLVPTKTYGDAYMVRDYDLDASKTVISQSPRRPFPAVTRAPPEQRDEIVYFGRIFQFKGVDKLVHAARLLLERRPSLDVKFVFIGQDAKESPNGRSHIAYLKSMIPDRVQARFEFTGQLTHEQVAERLGRAKFAVFPNEFESFCYAAHEIYQAGVPLVLNDLPGWADFFEDGRNAVLFDGSVDGTVRAMERLLDDPALAERIARPYDVAVDPLGTIYGDAKALAPIRPGPPPTVLALVIDEVGDAEARARTLAALASSSVAPDATFVLCPAGSTQGAEIPFLDAQRTVVDADGREVDVSQLVTREAVWMLDAGDVPDPWALGAAVTALGATPRVAFAGTWWRDGGRVVPSTLDVAPELYPYRQGPLRTRAVIRTQPGRSLLDLCDYRHGTYGEIGLLWAAADRDGPGCLLPRPGITVASAEPRPSEPVRLSFLVMTQRNPERLRRLARFSTIAPQDETAAEPLSRRRVKRLALQTLSARTLFKLGWKALWSRWRRRGR